MSIEIARKIVELALSRPVPIIGNSELYYAISGMQRFSQRQWESVKYLLKEVALTFEWEIDGQKYLISTYSPMLRSKFNFALDDTRTKFAAGFQVSLVPGGDNV